MIDCSQFKEHIIIPALKDINSYSEDAVELLLFTVAVESDGGRLLHQVKGPALGVFQMEPNTYHDIFRNFINYKPALLSMLAHNLQVNAIPPQERLIYDLKFSAVMARIHYLRVKEKLPNKNDINAIWEYYKKYYNTPAGKSQKENSMKKYQKYVGA